MKAYSLLYLSLFSFAALSACKPSRTAQTEKMKEMEKKELKMLEEAKPEISESEGDTIEDYYGTSREGLINWVLTDTATLSYPFTRSIEKNYVTIATSDDYNPQIQISAESETKRSIFREKDKTKRSKKESAQHSKSRNKSFVMTSVSAL